MASPGLCPTVGWGRACACSPRAPRGAPAACWPPPQAHRGACQGLGRQAMPPTLSRNKQRWLFLGRTDSWGPGWGQSLAGRVSSPRRSPRPASLWPGPVGAQVQRHHPPSSQHLPEASRGSWGPAVPPSSSQNQGQCHRERTGAPTVQAALRPGWRHVVTHLGCRRSGDPPASPEPPCVKQAEAREDASPEGGGWGGFRKGGEGGAGG